jgi:hypothetical protein
LIKRVFWAKEEPPNDAKPFPPWVLKLLSPKTTPGARNATDVKFRNTGRASKSASVINNPESVELTSTLANRALVTSTTSALLLGEISKLAMEFEPSVTVVTSRPTTESPFMTTISYVPIGNLMSLYEPSSLVLTCLVNPVLGSLAATG